MREALAYLLFCARREERPQWGLLAGLKNTAIMREALAYLLFCASCMAYAEHVLLSFMCVSFAVTFDVFWHICCRG